MGTPSQLTPNVHKSNVQIVVGAMVSGPNTFDRYNDIREDFRLSEVAIDYQTALVLLLTAVLDLPAEFWHGGNLTAIAEECHTHHFRHYPWESSQ